MDITIERRAVGAAGDAVDLVLAGRIDAQTGPELEQAVAEAIALVLVAEVRGLIGAELIRPLTEATAHDQPLAAAPAGGRK